MKSLGILKTKQNIHLMKQINIPEQILKSILILF